MKFFAVISLFLAGFVGVADAATPQQRRGQSTANTAAASTNAPATSARAAVSARAATRNTPAANASATTGARAAVSARAGKTQTVANSNTKPATQTVSARAGTTQKVINTGTKVAEATQNTVVSDACRQKYDGCLDSFCMLDNVSGGRCLCSSRYAELEEIRAEIAKIDSQAYQLATVGVERIEMGDAADDVLKNANAVAQSLTNSETKKESRRKRLDSFTVTIPDEEDIFNEIYASNVSLEGKEGAELFRAVHNLCAESMTECNSELPLLEKIYSQRIRSDCSAYENALEKNRKESQTKLTTAEQDLRAAALEAYQNSNKYDLGQCTIKFKECMATTAGCNDDFTGCVGIAAAENAKKSSRSKEIAQYVIKGTATQISIAASSYDALESKKPLCYDTVTKNCTRVKDQVWDAFIKEIAPTIKTAELQAESNLRQSCMANISSCIENACKDYIDPNDKDGSYDLCLSRPSVVQSLCKVQIDPCVAAEPNIMTFVEQRLAGMRVNACTNQIKSCLQDENRCGKNYENCVGMDVNLIKDMCPKDVLTSCIDGDNKKGLDDEGIQKFISGLFFQIDTAMLDQCQKIANDKVIEVCGALDTCAAFENDDVIGTESLLKYTDSNNNYVIEGLMSFGNLQITANDAKKSGIGNQDDEGSVSLGAYKIDIGDYRNHLNETEPAAARVVSTLQSVANKISQKIAIIANDPKVQMCTQGRDVKQITGRTDITSSARYPRLLDSAVIMIANAGLDKANKNYRKKYDELVAEAMESQNDSVKAATCAAFARSGTPEYECEGGESWFALDRRDKKCSIVRPYAGLFNDADNIGVSGKDVYSTKYVIKGADLQKSMEIASSGKGEFIQTDTFGNMMGKISMSAVYSAENNTCTLTTTTTMCKNAEAVITTDTDCSYAGTSLVGGNGGCNNAKGKSGGGGGIMSSSTGSMTTTEHYAGNVCTEFRAPETTTQAIKM